MLCFILPNYASRLRDRVITRKGLYDFYYALITLTTGNYVYSVDMSTKQYYKKSNAALYIQPSSSYIVRSTKFIDIYSSVHLLAGH